MNDWPEVSVTSSVSNNSDYGTIRATVIPLSGGGCLVELAKPGGFSVLLTARDFKTLNDSIMDLIRGHGERP